jgi:hypothetical protein
MQHMQKLPARPDCHNHLIILSTSFTACANNLKMQKVLQASSVANRAHAPRVRKTPSLEISSH